MTTQILKDADAVMLLGPTASGKTALALKAAKIVPCEIISIDSALVYKKMDIGTAKPTKEELEQVPHHLIDIIEPTEAYSTASFVSDCERLVKEIRAKGRLPIIVGGTMLYAKALREGLSKLPTSTPEVREKIANLLKEKGLPFLYEELKKVDPDSAQRLSPNDTQRISRAMEVYELSGRPLTSFFGEVKGTELNIPTFALFPEDRKELHQRIALRFEQMLENGFLDEVRSLKEIPGLTKDHSSIRCVGYRQAWDYLDGLTSFDEFKEAGIAATRQLAKRQITWLRSMKDVTLLNGTSPENENTFLKACRLAAS